MSTSLSSADTVLQIEHLRFGWPGRPLFNDLSLALPPGLSLVTGDDGCGKSTLLALLAGDLAPQGGTVCVRGTELALEPAAYRQQVFWIHPQTQAHDAISPAAYLASLPAQYPRFDIDALADLIEGFGLQPHLHKPLYMLSAGSRRKVWLSAAMAAGTPLTLIDQPFAALDGPSTRFLSELLHEAAHHGQRAWLVADHAAPPDVPLARVIRLG